MDGVVSCGELRLLYVCIRLGALNHHHHHYTLLLHTMRYECDSCRNYNKRRAGDGEKAVNYVRTCVMVTGNAMSVCLSVVSISTTTLRPIL